MDLGVPNTYGKLLTEHPTARPPRPPAPTTDIPLFLARTSLASASASTIPARVRFRSNASVRPFARPWGSERHHRRPMATQYGLHDLTANERPKPWFGFQCAPIDPHRFGAREGSTQGTHTEAMGRSRPTPDLVRARRTRAQTFCAYLETPTILAQRPRSKNATSRKCSNGVENAHAKAQPLERPCPLVAVRHSIARTRPHQNPSTLPGGGPLCPGGVPRLPNWSLISRGRYRNLGFHM